MGTMPDTGYLPSGASGLKTKNRDSFEEIYSYNSNNLPSNFTSKSVRFQTGETDPPFIGSEMPPERPKTVEEYCNSATMDPLLQGNTGNNLGISLAGFRSAKYTPQEWHNNNYARFYQAFLDRNTSERIRNESNQTMAETEGTTNKTQDENTKKLGQRVHDINFWKVELEREIKDMIDETNRLVKQKQRLENALYTTEFPLHIATECLNNRQRRPGVDLVQDEVECALLKEIEVINNVQDLLRKTIFEADKQIAANRAKKKELEFDWSDKVEAFEIDKRNFHLRNEDTNKQFFPGAATLAEKMSTPESWAQFSHDTILRAENERMASIQLRQLIDNILEDTARDMREQADIVERALHKRIAEVEEAKQKMSDQLKKTVDEIAAQERNIDNLKRALRDKEAPLKVAQTRLHNRSFRPNVELSADPPQYGLINEVNEINNSIEQLLQKLKDAENSLHLLNDQRMALEKEIGLKKNSLMIDREKAANYRSRYPTTNRLLGYNH